MTRRGERGPQGDHGQTGDAGLTGPRGRQGEPGEQGPHYSSWLTRHVFVAYALVVLGVIMGFVFTTIRFEQAMRRIDLRATELCEAGNRRSTIQAEDFAESAMQAQSLDLERLLGLDPAAAAEVRRLSMDNANRRIARLPFLDCETGERLPVPPR